ncbi:hypothetical protein XELAEV_18029044mg [Xenopus laevis]|uniref:Uncharacterized protein n=1 Tax=Xenopus laevis TaxID=8355 RepID=A0A974CRB4_XENLA|nr:hypothetical protein XELAEV_18029044mg [Xenopus laevis]
MKEDEEELEKAIGHYSDHVKKPGLFVFIGDVVFGMGFVHPLSISQINFQIKVLSGVVLSTALHGILKNGAAIPPLFLNRAQVLPILLTPQFVRVSEATVVHLFFS